MITVENRLYRPREVVTLMAIDRVSFWRAFKRIKPRPIQMLGPRSIRLYPEAVRQMIAFFKVETPADEARIADKRTTRKRS